MQTFKELITELYEEFTHLLFKRLDQCIINVQGLRISNNCHTEYARKILKKAELALV